MEINIDKQKLYSWIAETDRIPLKEKRAILTNFRTLSEEELVALYEFSKSPKGERNLFKSTKFTDTLTGSFIIGLIKLTAFLGVLGFGWYLYATPSGILVKSLPGSVWATRSALELLAKEMPRYHDLVVNNIDVLNFAYIEISGRHDGYAQMREDGQIEVSLFTQHKLEPAYLAAELVHEACHGKQFHDKRITMNPSVGEPRQKIEHECLLLQIATMKKLGGKPRTIAEFENTGRGRGPYGDDWKDSWRKGDTTNGMMDLLPKEMRIQWEILGFEKEWKSR